MTHPFKNKIPGWSVLLTMVKRKKTIIALCALSASAAAISASLCASRASRISKRKPKYTRAALFKPIRSKCTTPWRKILSCGSPGDFIVSINFPKALLLSRLLPSFTARRAEVNFGSPYRKGPKRRGRNEQMETIDLLGIALWYLKSRDPIYKMCTTFGLVPSSMSAWLDYSMEVLFKVVTDSSLTDFEIKWPTPQQMEFSAELLRRNRQHGQLLQGTFGISDGGRMPCAIYTNPDLQNAYFEGFTQAVEVSNLFVWNFQGEIIHAAINFPGTFHDSRIASLSGLYYPKLSDKYTPPGYAILADSAYLKDDIAVQGKVIRARKANERTGIPQSSFLAAVDLLSPTSRRIPTLPHTCMCLSFVQLQGAVRGSQPN